MSSANKQENTDIFLREKAKKFRSDDRVEKLNKFFLNRREQSFYEPPISSSGNPSNFLSPMQNNFYNCNIMSPSQQPQPLLQNNLLLGRNGNEINTQNYQISLNNNVCVVPSGVGLYENQRMQLNLDGDRSNAIRNYPLLAEKMMSRDFNMRLEGGAKIYEDDLSLRHNILRPELNDIKKDPAISFPQTERKPETRIHNFMTEQKYNERRDGDRYLTDPYHKYRSRMENMLFESPDMESRNQSPFEKWMNNEDLNKDNPQSNVRDVNFFSSGKKRVGTLKRVNEYFYDERDILGEGTFSRVYKGFCEKSNSPVAIKEIDMRKCNKNSIDEIYITKSVSSPNVVEIYDYHIDYSNSKCYLILEYCNQGSLELPDYSQLPLFTAIKYFQQIINGMKALFNLNILHRDLKRGNILLKDNVVKISDFGFAKNMGKYLEIDSIRCGTPSTMAPEIFFAKEGENNAKYNNKCDIWSLGVILHELVYGKHPFDLNPNQFHLRQRSQIAHKIPLVEDFLNKALVFSPRERMGWEEVFTHEINFYNQPHGLEGSRIDRGLNLGHNTFISKVFSYKNSVLDDLQNLSSRKKLIFMLILFIAIFVCKRIIGYHLE